MSKKCLVCGKVTEQYFCKKHNANKAMVWKFRSLSKKQQEQLLEKRQYETRLLKKSKEYPTLSITEVVKIAEKF